MTDTPPAGIYFPYTPLAVTRINPETSESETFFFADGKEYRTLEEFQQDQMLKQGSLK